MSLLQAGQDERVVAHALACRGGIHATICGRREEPLLRPLMRAAQGSIKNQSQKAGNTTAP
jgi:hypothetical protein